MVVMLIADESFEGAEDFEPGAFAFLPTGHVVADSIFHLARNHWGEVGVDKRGLNVGNALKLVEHAPRFPHVRVEVDTVNKFNTGLEDGGDAEPPLLLAAAHKDSVAHSQLKAFGEDGAKDDPIGLLGEVEERSAHDLLIEIGYGEIGGDFNAVKAALHGSETTGNGHIAPKDRCCCKDGFKGEHTFQNLRGMANSGFIGAPFPQGDFHGRAARFIVRNHARNGRLKAVLNAESAVCAEDGADEKLLESGGLGLGDDEQSDAKDDPAEAHEHGAPFRQEQPPCDAQVEKFSGAHEFERWLAGRSAGGASAHAHPFPDKALVFEDDRFRLR